MNISLKDVARRCKEYRKSQGYYQTDVAHDTGYSVENVSAFETGRNDNARILLWYIEHGMTYDHMRGDKYGTGL